MFRSTVPHSTPLSRLGYSRHFSACFVERWLAEFSSDWVTFEELTTPPLVSPPLLIEGVVPVADRLYCLLRAAGAPNENSSAPPRDASLRRVWSYFALFANSARPFPRVYGDDPIFLVAAARFETVAFRLAAEPLSSLPLVIGPAKRQPDACIRDTLRYAKLAA